MACVGSSLAAVDRAVAAGKLSEVAAGSLRRWLTGDDYAEFREEIAGKLASGDFTDLEDAFCRAIPFGTAGQRGPIGAGPNRINSRTLSESIQGVCNYVRQLKNGHPTAIIAYDTRRDSARFARLAAEILAGNGVPVHLFDEARPTPELSHAVVALKADLGFMVSASHNPPNDNGVKVYWDYGGQVLPEHADGITAQTAAVREIRRLPLEQARAEGLVRSLGAEMDREFCTAVLAQGMSAPSAPAARIVYTPLHGTGMDSVVPVLDAVGWREGENLFIVESQRHPDPEFRGVPGGIPNPENPESLDAGIELAKQTGADLVIASDPDADRMAAAVPETLDREGWLYFQGGQLASLLAWWALSQMQTQGRLPARGLAARTIITSDLVDAVAESFGVEIINNLPVGFKYIAQVIRDVDDPLRFIFGTEQSYGFVKGTYCRDKDAAIASLLLAELCEHLKREGRTVLDLLRDLWLQHGYHAERATPIRMEGVAGREQIAETMRGLRAQFPREIAGVPVTEVWDLLSDEVKDPATGRVVRRLGWNWHEDVLMGRLGQDPRSSVAVRPSGTEPSLKIYTNLRWPLAADARPEELDEASRQAEARAEALERDLLRAMGID